LTQYLYTNLREHAAPVFAIAAALFDEHAEYRVAAVALGMLSFSAVDDGYEPVLPYFERAAASEEWDVREMAQMFFRKVIKAYPDDMQRYLLQLVMSENPNIRRFVAEGLRPCIENQWFYKQPEYPLTVLRHLFRESKPYPRTSVGNNLSDLARRLPELVYELVAELVATGDKNSYWIAYRACRNLVKKEPVRVMDLLEVDTYTYKKRVHTRRDYRGN
jgi:3-methyladenine DNA glycosylase AlkC